MTNSISKKDRQFADLYFGGTANLLGNATACYRHLHPNAKATTCQVEGSKILSKPMVAKYLESRRAELTATTGINAEYVLRQSIRYLEIAFGDRPAPEGFNAMGVKAALELIGKNIGVQAFQANAEVTHIHKLEELLSQRTKMIEQRSVEQQSAQTLPDPAISDDRPATRLSMRSTGSAAVSQDSDRSHETKKSMLNPPDVK